MVGDSLLLLAVVLVAVFVLTTFTPRRRAGRRARRGRRLAEMPEMYEATPTDAAAAKLAAMARSPLAPALARAVDSPLPPSFVDTAPAVPYDMEEVRKVTTLAVARVNHNAPGLDVHLISVDGVRKHGDASGTVRYWTDITVYSKARNVSAKVSVVVEVRQQSGHVVIRRLAIHGTALSADPGLQAAHEVDQYATYEPALVYVPETGALEGSLLRP